MREGHSKWKKLHEDQLESGEVKGIWGWEVGAKREVGFGKISKGRGNRKGRAGGP